MAEFEFLRAGNSEATEKKALNALFASASGVLSGLVVTQTSTASGSVLIASGSALVHPSAVSSSLLGNDTSKTLDVFTANPVGGLPRNDIVAFDQITASILAIIGTPNATPSDPTVPATSVALSRLRHAASATTIPTAKIDTLIVATTLRGTTPVVASATARDALPKYLGLQVVRADQPYCRTETWDGTGWFTMVFNEETVTTNGSGDFSIATGLTSIKSSTLENANGGSATGNRQNVTVAKNAAYSGGNLTGRVYSADTHTAVASVAVGIIWNAWGYA